MHYRVIGDSRTALGFQLAGVESLVANTPEEGGPLLREAANDPDVGILMVTEKIAEANRSIVQEIRASEKGPVVVEIPGPEGKLPDRPSLIDLIQEALGIRI